MLLIIKKFIILIFLFTTLFVYSNNIKQKQYLKKNIDYSISFSKNTNELLNKQLYKNKLNNQEKKNLISPFSPPSAIYLEATPKDTFDIYLLNQNKVYGRIIISKIKNSGDIRLTLNEIYSYSQCAQLSSIGLFRNRILLKKALIYK